MQTSSHPDYTFFFYKNTFYKNIQAEISQKNKNIIRTSPASILGKKNFCLIFGSKFVIANRKSYYTDENEI